MDWKTQYYNNVHFPQIDRYRFTAIAIIVPAGISFIFLNQQADSKILH